jgi:hypothetical protein
LVAETKVTNSFAFRDIDVHHFSSAGGGPICMHGDEFFVETRKGPSDTLMIFLQGGGVCLTEVCVATAQPMASLRLFTATSAIGIGGILDARHDKNPARDFNVVNAPYCDGSLFLGDVDRTISDGNWLNGKVDKVYQRGLANITAVLETAKRTFPNPGRVILAGASGGAYGVVLGTALARYYYPTQPLLVLSDSGAPVVNGIDPNFITRALTELDAIHLIPQSCQNCIANGHATGMFDWALGRDPNLTFAYMTHTRDSVIGEFFMKTSAAQFQSAVITQTNFLLSKHPGRFFRFVIPGIEHTFLMTMGLGGLQSKGISKEGIEFAGYEWLQTLLVNPAMTPDVFQIN